MALPSPMCCCLPLFVLLTLATTGITFAQQMEIPPEFDCPAAAASPAPSNNGSINFTPFLDNVAQLMENLPSNASAAGGFASLSTGNGSDRAFVRGLCRGDALMRDCQACLKNASVELLSNCLTARRGAMWYEHCFVFFADTNASTAYEQTHRQELQNANTVADRVTFSRTYDALMRSLAERAANTTPEAAGAAPMFATGHAVFDKNAPNGTVYGLVQCMRDRTAAECVQCLKDSVPHLPECCYGRQGGLVLGYNCYLRMEVYTYYNLSLDARQPPLVLPPAPTPSPAGLVPPTDGEL